MNCRLQCLVFDESFNLVSSSPPFVEVFGASADEQSYTNVFLDFCPSSQPCGTPSKEKLEMLLARAFEDGDFCAEWLCLNSCKKAVETIKFSFTPIVLAGKAFVILHSKGCQLEDIEKQTRIGLEAILDTSHLLLTIFDSNGIPTYNSNSKVEFYGFESKEHLKENYHLIFPKFQSNGVSSFKHGIKIIQSVAKTGKKLKFPWEFQRLDGEIIPCEISLVPLVLDGEQTVLCHTKDLREQKQLKEEYAINLEHMMAMLDASPSMCLVFDQEYNCINTNQATADLLGLSDSKIFIERVDDFSPKFQPCGTPSREKMNQVLQYAFDFGKHNFEWIHRNLKGEDIPCEVYLSRATSYGKTVVIAYTRDMRKEKEMFEKLEKASADSVAKGVAEESNKAKTRFLARMSHEIRTPLTAILGISEMHLRAQKLSPQMEKSFIEIYNSSQLLLGIINDILDYSKIEFGKMEELATREYSLSSMISDVAHMHTVYLGGKGIGFIMNIDENLPEILVGDPTRIEQIVINLISNAFKYTEEGSVELFVDFEPRDCGGCIDLIIAIKDTGVGMTEEELETVYDEYKRFYKHDTHIISGAGLGLPIIATFANLMNAHVDIESQPNVGTTATVRIPQKVIGDKVLGADTVKSLQEFEASAIFNVGQFRMPPEPMPYGKVLVVDDVDANLYVARGLLEFYDLQVETCKSGFEAIEKVSQGNVYDIIFMDQMMPEISGIETKYRLRKMGYNHPIVALTANAMIGQAEEFMKKGFDDFLSKPILTKNLHSVLLKYVRDKQPEHIIQAARHDAERLGYRKNVNADDFQNSKELQDKLRSDFSKNQNNTFENIVNAINKGDLKHAYLLAHSLKGVAGLIYEDGLARAAAMVEQRLSKDKIPEATYMTALETELTLVLNNIGRFTPQGDVEIAKLLDDLQDLLQNRKSEAVNVLDPLHQIPEAAILVRQVKKFEFKAALGSITALRDILELW